MVMIYPSFYEHAICKLILFVAARFPHLLNLIHGCSVISKQLSLIYVLRCDISCLYSATLEYVVGF